VLAFDIQTDESICTTYYSFTVIFARCQAVGAVRK